MSASFLRIVSVSVAAGTLLCGALRGSSQAVADKAAASSVPISEPAAGPAWGQVPAPAVRIVESVDDSRLARLKGNTHPLARAAFDRGPVSADLPMGDLVLVLRRDVETQAAFDRFVASQYDAKSPNFHHWLTPEQVGEEFGPSPSDIATISNWLLSYGFTVDEVAKDRLSIRWWRARFTPRSTPSG